MKITKRKALSCLLGGLALAEIALHWAMPSWEVERTTAIDATPERVWALLSDFEGYASWNTYTPHVSGALEAGAIVRSRGHLGSFQFDVNNLVTSVVPGRQLCWRSQNWYRSLVWGTRCRAVEARGAASVIHHHEIFQGPLSWLVQLALRSRIERGIETHDHDLKKAAEGPHGRGPLRRQGVPRFLHALRSRPDLLRGAAGRAHLHIRRRIVVPPPGVGLVRRRRVSARASTGLGKSRQRVAPDDNVAHARWRSIARARPRRPGDGGHALAHRL